MKVAFLVHQYPPDFSTGTELYAHRLALALQPRGQALAVYTNDPDVSGHTAFRKREDELDGIAVTRVTFFDGLAPNHALHDYYDVFLGKVFGEWLDEQRPDVVHVFHLMGLGLSLLEECHARGIPVCVQIMDYWFLCPTVQLLRHDGSLCSGPETNACIECLAPDNYGYQVLRMHAQGEDFVEAPLPGPELIDVNHADIALRRSVLHSRPAFVRRMLDHATTLIAPSLFIRNLFLEHGYREDQMRHLAYGVQPLEGPMAALPVAGEGTVTFGFFGSVNPQKGLEVLVSAFRECRAENLRLEVRGNMTHFPKYAKRVRAFADIDPRIVFKGPFGHDELGQVLSTIDVLVVPSVWYENTPFVVLEAFSAGRPVVASDLGGLSELVQDGVNGRLFRAGDPGALMDVLRDFERDPELLLRLAGGIRPVRTLEDNADDFVDLWEQALAGALKTA